VDTIRIESVNVGRAETIRHGSREFTTGICKRPVDGAVAVGAVSVGDDAICDTEHHGGADQAVYVYSSEDYEWWSTELDRALAPGMFGENLTIRGLPNDLQVGDRLLIGDVVLEATAPRVPCSTLAARMGDSGFGLRFRKAERPGVYFRVLNEGTVAAGDTATLVDYPGPAVSILELFRLAYERNPDAATLERYLEAPLAERVRATIERRLSNHAA